MTKIAIAKDLSMTLRMSYEYFWLLKFNLCSYWINLADLFPKIIVFSRQICKYMNVYSKRETNFEKY